MKRHEKIVTFHAKTYTNSFVFNGLSCWVAVGNPLKAFTKPLEVLGKPLSFFHYPLEVLFSKPLEVLENSRLNNSFDSLE